MESAREGMEGEQLESYGTPSRCHEDIYKAYKLLITNVAGDLHADDVSTIIFVEDLPQDRTWKPLQVLHFLEKRGRFSCYDIEPLETLLKESNRCDLVNKYVTEYKRQYGTAAVQANSQLKRTTSAPPHQSPLTNTKRRSLPVGARDTAPTHPPATFDSVPEEATEIQAELQLQTGVLSLSNTVLATPQRSTSRVWKLKPSDFQGPSQEHPEKIFTVFGPNSMEENCTQHSLMPTHTPTTLYTVREGEMLPRTSTPTAPLPPQFSQQLPHSRRLVHPTPHGHSVTHSSSLSGSVHEMSGQSSLGQEASSSQELFTSQVPHMGASNAVYNGLNATGVHSSSQPLLNPCHIVEPSQPGHAFHQPTTLLHPQAFISLPSTSNKKMPSAVERSHATTAFNIEPPHVPRELTSEHQRSSQAAIQRPSALTLSNCSARSTQPPAHESTGGHKPCAGVSLCHLFGKKKGTVEHLVNRKKLYSIICEHKDREYMRLKNRIILDAGCKANPELGLKIYPCGLEDDRGKYATLETDIYIKQKCPRLILESCVVRLVIRVIDCKTGQNLNGDRVLTAEYPLRGRSFRIYQAIDHHSIMQSTSLMFKVRAAAVLIFPPAPQAEEYELVQSPEEEFLEITWKGGERSP